MKALRKVSLTPCIQCIPTLSRFTVSKVSMVQGSNRLNIKHDVTSSENIIILVVYSRRATCVLEESA